MTENELFNLQSGIAIVFGLVLLAITLGFFWVLFRLLVFVLTHPVLAAIAVVTLLCLGLGYLMSIPVMEGVRERVPVTAQP